MKSGCTLTGVPRVHESRVAGRKQRVCGLVMCDVPLQTVQEGVDGQSPEPLVRSHQGVHGSRQAAVTHTQGLLVQVGPFVVSSSSCRGQRMTRVLVMMVVTSVVTMMRSKRPATHQQVLEVLATPRSETVFRFWRQGLVQTQTAAGASGVSRGRNPRAPLVIRRGRRCCAQPG